MQYSYVCEPCGLEVILAEFQRIGASPSAVCPLCSGRIVRMVSSPAIVAGFQDGFNPTVGQYISSKHQLQSELDRVSDDMSARTGANHHYVPVDLRDPAALGVTDEGLDATRRHRRDSGTDAPPTTRIIA